MLNYFFIVSQARFQRSVLCICLLGLLGVCPAVQLHRGCKCVVGDILCVEFVSFVMSLAPYTVITWSIHDTDRLLFYVGVTALVLSFLI